MKILKKRNRKVLVPIAVFLFGVECTFLLLRLESYSVPAPPIQQPLSITQEPEVAAPGLPVRLKIPKINIDAAIEGLGLTPEGDLAAPESPDNTGWYNAGPRPGGAGSSVIDGHFGWAGNKPAVFDDLHTLQKGDVLYVEDDKKVTHTFVVSQLRTYRPDDDATAVFRSSDGRAHLNLITCQGVWNKDQESYATRLVVFADSVVAKTPPQ